MDLNEYSKIQCLNCHADILASETSAYNPEQNGSVCQVCLNQQSTIITAYQMQIEALKKQSVRAQNYEKQASLYLSNNKSISEDDIYNLQAQLDSLEKEFQDLNLEQQEANKQMSLLLDQYDFLTQSIEKQNDQLHLQEVNLKRSLQVQLETLLKVQSLKSRCQSLNKLHILSQLYSVHYDQKQAFINKQPMTFTTSPILLEIVSLLAEKYQYHRFKVNFCNLIIKIDEQVVKVRTENQQATIPWLKCLIKQTLGLWEYLKKEISLTSKQSYPIKSLRCKVTIEPQIKINDILVQSGPSYSKILKYLTMNIKNMMDLDAIGQFDPEIS